MPCQSEPPYFILKAGREPMLELASDGSYEECCAFARDLEVHFGTVVREKQDAGPIPEELRRQGYDKEKGYWFLLIDGEEFVLMRDRGFGMCLFGPPAPASPATFLKIARSVRAVECLTFGQRILAWGGIRRPADSLP